MRDTAKVSTLVLSHAWPWRISSIEHLRVRRSDRLVMMLEAWVDAMTLTLSWTFWSLTYCSSRLSCKEFVNFKVFSLKAYIFLIVGFHTCIPWDLLTLSWLYSITSPRWWLYRRMKMAYLMVELGGYWWGYPRSFFRYCCDIFSFSRRQCYWILFSARPRD